MRSARRATRATAAPFSASTVAKRAPSPLDAPVTRATRPVRSNSSAAFMRSPRRYALSPIKRGRQGARKPRPGPQHDQHAELDQHERDDADVDMHGGDLRRRDAAQVKERRAERWVQV